MAKHCIGAKNTFKVTAGGRLNVGNPMDSLCLFLLILIIDACPTSFKLKLTRPCARHWFLAQIEGTILLYSFFDTYTILNEILSRNFDIYNE